MSVDSKERRTWWKVYQGTADHVSSARKQRQREELRREILYTLPGHVPNDLSLTRLSLLTIQSATQLING